MDKTPYDYTDTAINGVTLREAYLNGIKRVVEQLKSYPYSELNASGTGRDPSAIVREIRIPLLEWQDLEKGGSYGLV